MPNWTYNRIKCKKSIGDKILTITENGYSFDFNKLIPMPDDLKLDAGSIEGDSIACYYLSLNDDEKNKLMKLLKSKEASYCHNYWNKYKDDIKKLENNPKRLNKKINNFNGLFDFDKEKQFTSINELGKQYVENIKKYNFPQWYDWCVKNWGTKWNVEEDVDIVYDKNIDEYDISFQTAWSVPTGIVKRYSELCEDDEEYEDDEFYWEYEDEDYDGTHILRKINGEIIDTIVPECVNDNDYIDV